VDVRAYVTKEAGCDILLCPQSFEDDEFLCRRRIRRVNFPELNELAEPLNAKHYPYEKTPKEALNDPMLILHTSGSSGENGFPKVSITKSLNDLLF
jgi:hypothetical protein